MSSSLQIGVLVLSSAAICDVVALGGGGYPACWRMFRRIPGSTHEMPVADTPQLGQLKMTQTLPRGPWGAGLPSGGLPWTPSRRSVPEALRGA